MYINILTYSFNLVTSTGSLNKKLKLLVFIFVNLFSTVFNLAKRVQYFSPSGSSAQAAEVKPFICKFSSKRRHHFDLTTVEQIADIYLWKIVLD